MEDSCHLNSVFMLFPRKSSFGAELGVTADWQSLFHLVITLWSADNFSIRDFSEKLNTNMFKCSVRLWNWTLLLSASRRKGMAIRK